MLLIGETWRTERMHTALGEAARWSRQALDTTREVHMKAFWKAKALLAHGADANAKSDDGWTPLSMAADGGQMEAARVLLAHGADVNAGTQAGLTPLKLAFLTSNPELADLLRKHGAKE